MPGNTASRIAARSRFYIELMFMFGSSFDTDPQYPWASGVLANPESVHQDVRADRLYAAMNTYLAQVVEPDRHHLRQALQRLLDRQFEDVALPGENLEHAVLEALHSVCPARCEYVGETTLKGLIRHGSKLAQDYGFEPDKGKLLMVILTLVMGHGFPDDPLNPWIVRGSRNRVRQAQVNRLNNCRLSFSFTWGTLGGE